MNQLFLGPLLALGAAGLPWFAGGNSGLAYLAGIVLSAARGAGALSSRR